MLHSPEYDATICAAEPKGIRQGEFMMTPPGLIGNEIHTVKLRIGNIIYGRQEDPFPHTLDGQDILNGGGGPEGMTNLGFIR